MRAVNEPGAYCSAGRTFRPRSQRSARPLRHGQNIPRARPMIRMRVAARGEHSARAANDPHAYCGAGRTFRARGQRSVRVLRRGENIPRARPTICTRIAARGEHSARASNDPQVYCGAGRTFRTRAQRSARVLRHRENIPRAQPTIRTRIAARGEHSARAANDLHAYCGARRTFRARGQRSTCVLRRGGNIPRARPTIRTRMAARGEHSARGAYDPHAYCVIPPRWEVCRVFLLGGGFFPLR